MLALAIVACLLVAPLAAEPKCRGDACPAKATRGLPLAPSLLQVTTWTSKRAEVMLENEEEEEEQEEEEEASSAPWTSSLSQVTEENGGDTSGNQEKGGKKGKGRRRSGGGKGGKPEGGNDESSNEDGGKEEGEEEGSNQVIEDQSDGGIPATIRCEVIEAEDSSTVEQKKAGWDLWSGMQYRVCKGHYGKRKKGYELRHIPGAEKRPLQVNAWAGFVPKFPEYVGAQIDFTMGYPKNQLDIKAFLNFACRNADTFGIDCSRIALVGYSNSGEASNFIGNQWRKAKGIQAVMSVDGVGYGLKDLDKSDIPAFLMFVGNPDKGAWFGYERMKKYEPEMKQYNVDHEIVEMDCGHYDFADSAERVAIITDKTRKFFAKHLSG